MIQKLTIVFTTIKPAGGFFIGLFAILAPITPIMYAVLFLIFADTLTGIIASYKREDIKFKIFSWSSWKHITSNRLGDSITKSLVYMLLIICGFVIDTFIIPNAGLMVTKIMAGAVSLREIKSLLENGETILGGGLFSMIRAFMKGGFKGGMSNILKDKNEKKD